jgi:uncharacterized protein YukE
MAAEDSWALLGGDPAPGDLGQLAEVINLLTLARQGVGDEAERLASARGAAQEGDGVDATAQMWTGPAAAAFAGRQGDLVKRLNDAYDAFDTAVGALTVWSDSLAVAQQSAASLLAHAEQVSGLPDGDAIISTLTSQNAELALSAQEDAAQCASVLAQACTIFDAYIPKPQGGLFGALWNDVTGALETVSHALGEANKYLGVIALLTAPIPIVGEVVDAVALVSAATETGADLVLATSGKGSFTAVGWDLTGLAGGYTDGIGEALAHDASGGTDALHGVFADGTSSLLHPLDRVSESVQAVRTDGFAASFKSWQPSNLQGLTGRSIQVVSRSGEAAVPYLAEGS